MDQKQLVDYAELIRLRETGMENKDIAAKFGVSLSTVIHGLRKGGWKGYQRNCALVGCGKEFWTGSLLGKYCCRSHAKRHLERARLGTVVGEAECALPECSKRFLKVGKRSNYCSRKHCDLHLKRMSNDAAYYRRVLRLVGTECMVCGEKFVLDEHHIEFKGTKSNKQSKTVWLCPTHHMAIHRGFARFEGEQYVSMVPAIADGLKRKHPELLKVGGGGGRDWSAK